jgi:hypothetical protein
VSSRGQVHKGTRVAAVPPTEFVRSHFHATWVGAVLRRDRYEYNGKRFDSLTVVLLVDRHGNRMSRKIVKTLSERWTTPIGPVDTSWVNPDWWRIA